MSSYQTLSSTFLGFTEVQADTQTVVLSTTVDVIVDIEIDGPSTSNRSTGTLAPSVLAISGGFLVCDPNTGAVTNNGALLAQSHTDATNPSTWFIRLVFPPQASAATVLAKAWGRFAVFSGGTN
ncbi:MAG: hypothetical protein ACREQ5_00560 [Candidatus Dormibacteria bacterium]